MLISPEENSKFFKWEIAGSKQGWSSIAMDWINFMSYDENLEETCDSENSLTVIVGDYKVTEDTSQVEGGD